MKYYRLGLSRVQSEDESCEKSCGGASQQASTQQEDQHRVEGVPEDILQMKEQDRRWVLGWIEIADKYR